MFSVTNTQHKSQHYAGVVTLSVAVMILSFAVMMSSALTEEASSHKIDEQIKKIREQSCPIIGMKGPKCKGDVYHGQLQNGDIRSGLGYDTYKHEVMPQVLKSKAAVSLGDNKYTYLAKVMSNAKEYYSMLYDNSKVYNGLYSHNKGASQIFDDYFKGRMKISDTQKIYYTHKAESVSKSELTSEFKQLIDVLPEKYDESIYQKVLDAFGNTVSVSNKYGGVIDSLVSLRDCYSSKDMEKYLKYQLENSLNNKTIHKLPNGFINYRKVSQLDVVGGNPELSNPSKRIDSFQHNPVAVDFDLIPLWKAFPSGSKRNNMKKLIDKYESSNSDSVAKKVSEINQKREKEFKEKQTIHTYYRQTHRCSNPLFYYKKCERHHQCRHKCAYLGKKYSLKSGHAENLSAFNCYVCPRSSVSERGDAMHINDESSIIPSEDTTDNEYYNEDLMAEMFGDNVPEFAPEAPAPNGCKKASVHFQALRKGNGEFYYRTAVYTGKKLYEVFKKSGAKKEGCINFKYRDFMILGKYRPYIDNGMVMESCAMCTPYVKGGYKVECGCPKV